MIDCIPALPIAERPSSVNRIDARPSQLATLRGFATMAKMSASTVAVIDDDDDVGDVLGGLLEAMGYEVATYRSGPEFLADTRKDRLACLIVDQNMPKMKGLDMIAQLSELGINIPALLITGAHDPEIERRAASLGVMTVLEKPMSHHELLRFISISVG
ncbi:MAG: response regulator [Acetobacteraceae bacterium]|nr:response regulator [Pseudomonadota bacterium]